MTSAVVTPSPRLSRRAKVSLVALLVVMAGWFAYVANYALCDTRSQFCVLNIAGTRSEIGAEWDTWSIYVSTSGNDPATHVLIQL